MIRACLVFAVALFATAAQAEPAPLYGSIGSLKATPGNGAALLADLPNGCSGMPGCLSYIVANDAKAPDTLWVSEVWTSKAAHDASLSLPVVRAAITKARPIIAGFGIQVETVPVSGVPAP